MKKIFPLLVINFFFLFVSAQPTPTTNVGIGTTTPTRAKLEVHGAVDATSAIFGGESSGISLQRNWPGIGFNSYYNNGHRYLANGYAVLQFMDPGSGYMAFDMFSNGVAGGLPPITRRAMVLTNDGRVTIGSADFPPATLYVARGTGFDGTAAFQGTTFRSHFNYATSENTYIRAGKSNGNVFINDVPGGNIFIGNGNSKVGINTQTPDYALEIRQITDINGFEKGMLLVNPRKSFDNWGFSVNSSVSQNLSYLYFSFNGLSRVQINPTNGNYNSISDGRLKTNIRVLSTVLSGVMQLRPVEYEMKGNVGSGPKTLGFIAQEVKNIFPELVQVADGKMKNTDIYSDLHTMTYSGFGVLAIKAIQEQQILISDQQKQIDELKDLTKTLLEKINHLTE